MSSTFLGSRVRTAAPGSRAAGRRLAGLRSHPEVLGLAVIAGLLNLVDLSRNQWANTFYAGAVRSMSTSWHDFLFGSLDKAGLMTVDKPPAAFWVQALSVRIFGWHPLSILVPEALMGVAAVVLAYDLTRRRFGRGAGFAAGLVLALTPITVAMSRHNNPDELLILSCVAAMWFAVRALADGRTRWLLWCGAFIGLGFETKMAVALFVAPGIAIAYLWMAPAGKGHFHALRQLLLALVVLLAVALAWPLLVVLTPAADRPWISGTSDNSIWSLIVGYNGLGRVAGQAGGTAGAGGGFGAGDPSVVRLLGESLGGQAGWLLGAALVAGLGILGLTRGRRSDPRTGWVLAVGGAALVSAVVFSAASGIFHPYYVSFLAPWVAMLVGAGVGLALSAVRVERMVGLLAIAGGAVTELIVLGEVGGSVAWARWIVVVLCAVAVLVLAFTLSARVRTVAVAVAVAALLAAPGAWAVDTLGYATSSTFPAGGPQDATSLGGGGGFGAGRGFPGRLGAGVTGARSRGQGSSRSGGAGGVGGGFGLGRSGSGSGTTAGAGAPAGAGGAGMFGGDTTSLTGASKYAASHGGGTVAVESQSSAAQAIVDGQFNVAGIGGFSGRESTVSVRWLAMEVRDGKLRWLLDESTATTVGGGGFAGRGGASGGASTGSPFGGGGLSGGSGTSGGGFPGGSGARGGGFPGGSARGGSAGGGSFGGGDNRDGSEKAIALAEKVSRKITFTYDGTRVTMYDLRGRAAAILAAAAKQHSTSSSAGTTL